jgi:hypothetical protein
VPEFGCFKDVRRKEVKDAMKCIERIWKIGGTTGWYYANWLWKLRGFIDKLFGGVGLKRGRTNLIIFMPVIRLIFGGFFMPAKMKRD